MEHRPACVSTCPNASKRCYARCVHQARLPGEDLQNPISSSVRPKLARSQQIHIHACDSANRLIQVTHSPSTTGTITYTYGTNAAQYNVGRLVTMTDPSGSESYSYDSMGRLVSMSKVIGGTPYNVGYQYNAAGDLTKLTYPSGRIVQYSYDAVGHLCAVAASTSSCSTYTNPYLTISSSNYDAAGRPLFATYGNGVVASSSYTPTRAQLSTVSYSKGATIYLGLQYWHQNDSTH